MACRCQRLNQRRIKGHRSLRPNRQMVAVPEQGSVEFVWKGVLKSQAALVETAPASSWKTANLAGATALCLSYKHLVHFKSLIKSIYCCCASSCDVPASAFHASHFARPIMSVKPGRSPLASPELACLNSA